MKSYTRKETPIDNFTPFWVMWAYLDTYQRDGLEWSSPEKIGQDFAIRSRKLLRTIKTKGE